MQLSFKWDIAMPLLHFYMYVDVTITPGTITLHNSDFMLLLFSKHMMSYYDVF